MKKILIVLLFQSLIYSTGSAATQNTTHSSKKETIAESSQKAKSLDEAPIDEVEGAFDVKKRKPPHTAALPTGKTLPQGFFRVETPVAYTWGQNGWSSAAKPIKNGFWVNRWITGFLVSYGLSDTVSLGIGVPFVAMNKMGLDGNEFTKNSEFYKKYFNKSVEQSAEFLVSVGQCNGATSVAACSDQIVNNNLSLPVSSTIVLPTGETYNIKANVPITDQIRNLVVNSTIPQDGNTGLGDIQVGILWNPLNERTPLFKKPLFLSIGGGLRFPTGKFDLPMAFRQTGGDGTLLLPGGTLDAILRWNADYEAMNGLILSWENSMEFSLTKPNLNRSSMLRPSQFNKENPEATVPGVAPAVNKGDGVPNVLVFERRGPRFHGFLEAQWGLGNTFQALKPAALYLQGKYNIMSQNYLNGMPVYLFQDQFYLNEKSLHPNYGPQQAYSVVGGLKISGLPYRFPLEAKFEYEYIFYGRNLFIAPMNLMFVLALYF